MSAEVVTAVAVEEITTTDAPGALRDEWSALWSRCPGATPFQAPEWLIPWWRAFGDGVPWTLALRHEGRLVGLVPLFLPAPRGRTVLLVGTGNTDLLDALVEPGFEGRGAEAAFAHLAANADRWDACDFQQLREGSPLLRAGAPAGWADGVVAQDVCPTLDLPDGIPIGRLKRLRSERRRAGRVGPVRFERADQSNFATLFPEFLRLHEARWSAQGQPGVLHDPIVRRFHEEAASAFLRAGMLRLYVLFVDSRAIASFYGFAGRSRMFYYLGGFDPEFASLSPGTLIVGYAIEEAVREGAEAFEFLRGREPYKYGWGAKDRLNVRRLIDREPAKRGPSP
ncbi:MAG TPA: GNAT family N-acetyltransferase [Isosphaeraceae bacterium]|nr:GNAT family N-acetyltransferase [Isosphaeraceae bacterium]